MFTERQGNQEVSWGEGIISELGCWTQDTYIQASKYKWLLEDS